MFFNKDTQGELITPDLERAGFLTWLSDAVGKVVTNAIRSFGVTGHDNTLIGEAWELYDKTGTNTLVGHEVALISPPSPDGIHRKRGVFNAVLKGRQDTAPPGPRRNVPNSVGFWISAQPELRAESVAGADPNTLFGPAVDIPDNPGAAVCRVTPDMLVVGGLPALVGSKLVGVPFVDAAQPAFVVDQRPDGTTWFVIRDYGHRPEGLCEGTGAFFSFQTTNADGVWSDTVLLNGGFIDRTPGVEQGDLDILTYVDGKINGVALVGNMTKDGGPAAGVLPVVDDTLNLGGPRNRWVDLYLSGNLHAPTVSKNINGKQMDCIQVNTPAGIRWLPVYESN